MKHFLKNSIPICKHFICSPRFLRSLELASWFAANTINWIFMIICASAMVYWIKQLRILMMQEQKINTTAHSFKIKFKKIKSIGNYFKSFPISFLNTSYQNEA
jgi:hypothetical protein